MATSRQLVRLEVLDCDASVEVEDLVAVGPGGVLIRAQADSINTMPAVGFVVQKNGFRQMPYSTNCILERGFRGGKSEALFRVVV